MEEVQSPFRLYTGGSSSYVKNYFRPASNESDCELYLSNLPRRLKDVAPQTEALHDCREEEQQEIEFLRPYLRPRSAERARLQSLGMFSLARGRQEKQCRQGGSSCGPKPCKQQQQQLLSRPLRYYANLYLFSSSIWESRILITVFSILSLVSLLLVDNNIIPQSGIYPMAETPFTFIGAFFTFTFAILAAASYARYDTPVRQYYVGLLGNLTDAAINVTALLRDVASVKPIPTPRYLQDATQPCGWRVVYCRSTAAEELDDLRHVMSSLPFAMKISFRDGVEVDPELLPMPRHLQEELKFTAGATLDYLDSLRRMYVHKVSRLIEINRIPSFATSGLLSHSNALGGNIGETTYGRRVFSLMAILGATMRLALYSWMIFVPFFLYQFWGLVMGILLTLLTNIIFLGVISTLDNDRNPFSRGFINEFLGIDLGQEARDVAQKIDRYFDSSFMDLESYRRAIIPIDLQQTEAETETETENGSRALSLL